MVHIFSGPKKLDWIASINTQVLVTRMQTITHAKLSKN